MSYYKVLARNSRLRRSSIFRMARTLILASLGLAFAASLQAATTVVTSLGDSGAGSLRSAFSSSASGDTITFDASLDGQTISLTTYTNAIGCVTASASSCINGYALGRQFGASAFFLTDGKSLTIDATANGLQHGITLARSGSANFRFFDIDSNSNLTLRGLVLQNGAAVGGSSNEGGGALGAGGAIFNRGHLDLDRCTLTSNRAVGGNTGIPGVGPDGGAGVGAIYSSTYPCPYCGVFGGRPNGGDVGLSGGTSPPYNAFPGKNGGLGGGGGRGGQSYQYQGGGGSGYYGAGGRGGDGGFGGGGARGGDGDPAGAGGNGGFGAGGGRPANIGITAGLGGFGGGTATWQQSGPGAGLGGAIFNDAGTVVIARSTFALNLAQGGSGTVTSTPKGSGFGGAIFNYNGSMSLDFVTLAGNLVTPGSTGVGGAADGGAVYNLGDSSAACSAGGNECSKAGATLDMHSSIASGHSAAGSGYNNDVVSTSIHGGVDSFVDDANWIEKWSGSADVHADPLLGSLSANGGFGLTMLPADASPVIDQAGTSCTTQGSVIDQRGFAKPQGSACDPGAVEVRQASLAVVVIGDGVVSADSSPAPLTGGIADCGESGPAGCEASYIAEVASPVIILTSVASENTTFIGWAGECAGMQSPISVTLSGDRHCEANFATNFAVSASVVAGSGSVSPVTQRVPLDHSASVAFAPDPGFHVSATAGTCGGQLDAFVYTTSPVTQDCTVAVSFAQDPVVDLVVSACRLEGMSCASSEDYVQYGSYLSYMITAGNMGNTTAFDVIASANSADLDTAASSWICVAEPGATCQEAGSGALADSNVILPPGSHVVWIVDALVGAESANAQVDYVATLGRASDPGIHSATWSSTLVLFRGGFEEYAPTLSEEKHPEAD